MCRLCLKKISKSGIYFLLSYSIFFFKDLLKIATSRLKLENSANGAAEFLDQTVLSDFTIDRKIARAMMHVGAKKAGYF